MINLYINNQLVDINDDVVINVTRSLDDSVNPTTLITSYSKTVSLPMTKNNNKIFKEFFKFDKFLDDNDLNPNKKIPFTLFDNSDLLWKGFVKFTDTTSTYNITLYDELWGVLNSMAQKSVVYDLPFFNVLLNRNTLMNSWNYVHSLTGSNVYDYITFVPSDKGLYDNFTSNEVQVGSDFTSLLYNVNEFQQKEIRSYYQQPAIYYNKLIQAIADNNDIVLDDDFHNENNPYWKDTVIMFQDFSKPTLSTAVFGNTLITPAQYDTVTASSPNANIRTGQLGFVAEYDPYNYNMTTGLDVYPAYNTTGVVKVNYEIKLNIKLSDAGNIPGTILEMGADSDGSENCKFKINVGFNGQLDGRQVVDYNTYITLTDGMVNQTDVAYIQKDSGDNFYYVVVDGIKDIIISGTSYISTINNINNQFSIKLAFQSETGGNRYMNLYPKNSGVVSIALDKFLLSTELVSSNFTVTPPDILRTDYPIRLSNIVPNDLKEMNLLLNHIKMFNLAIKIVDGKYTIMDKNKFFADAVIRDYNNLLDYNKEIKIENLPYDKRYKILKYKDIELEKYKSYKTAYSIDYCSTVVDTNYEFNSDNDTLYENIFNAPLISCEYFYDYNNNRWERNVYNTVCQENTDKSDATKKTAQKSDMTMLFYNGLTSSVPLYISDDTELMTTEDNYCWCNTSTYSCTRYDYFPLFSSYTNDYKYSLEYSKNSLYYHNIPSTYTSSATLYDRFFKNWVEERYSNNTRIVTIYANINVMEYKTLKINDFILLEDTLFLVNKIEDFNLIDGGIVKMELIKVNDKYKYIDGQSCYDIDYSSLIIPSLHLTDNHLVATADVNNPTFTFDINDDGYLIIKSNHKYSGIHFQIKGDELLVTKNQQTKNL